MSWKNAISEFVPPSPRNVGSSFGRRSRLQQQLQQLRRQKTKLQALREQRERDFCLYFNIPDPRHIRGPTSAKRRPAIQSPASTAIRSVSAPSVDRARKAWTTRKKCEIRAESGEVFSFTPADYSSDDFGTDDENADGNDSTVSGPDDNCAHTDGQNMAYDRGSDDAETASEKGFYSCLSETSTSSATRLSFPSLPFSLHLLEYLQIEVFSNWGDNDLVGISHLKLCLEAAETSLVPIVEVQLYRSSRLDSDPASQKIANATEEPHLFCTQNTLPLTVRVLFDISRTPSEARYAVIKIGNYYGTSRFAAGVRECRLMAITSQAQTHVLFEGELQKACEHSEAVDSNCFRFSLQNEAEEPFRMAKCVGELATNVLQCLEEACEFSFAPSPSLSPGSPIWHSSAESGRQRFDAIEMSWGSLELFNRLQAGRLAVNAQLNSLPGIDESLSIVRDSLEDTASVDGSETSVEIDGKPDTYFINDPAAGNEGETTDEDFSIPELPVGNELLLDILSTWGDPHYVGLTSIQVFTADGLEISRECRISAYPPDINILPQFSSDPRVAVNLIDGVNETQDRTHMWLIPFTPGGHHWLRLVLPENAEPIAMIRIWNYNESRVHSSRGARDIKIFLDRKCIFRGQISRSSGLERGKPQEFGETILFTTDEAVLQRIAEHDQAFLRDIEEEEEEDDDLNHMVVSEGLSDGESAATDAEGVKTRWLDLRLLNAWDGGKCGCIGIAGIKLLADPDGRKEARVWLTCQIDPPVSQFWVDPNTLTDGLNHTTDENHMWTAKFTESVGLQLRFWLIPPDIDLVVEEQEVVDPPTLYGIRLWNYNAPKQCGRASGVKFFQILDDRGRCLGNLFGQEGPFLLKPGPGHLKYDFSQQFLFADLSGTTWNYFPDSIFVLEISLLSNWGDEERIGLSGLQLLGCRSEILPIQPEQVYLHPGVVSELDLLWSNGDVWNPKRLVRTTVAGGDCPSSWSMPINPRGPNQIFVVFDRPVRLVGARIWNYCNRGETSMGARDISIRLDDQLVFAGTLPEYETASPNKPILIGWDTKRKPIANRRAQDTYICTA